MTKILHLSDLHFGRTDAHTVQALQSFAHQSQPDAVVVSGDLTQRARPSQFQEAKKFLDSLPAPKLVVAGNHDIPLDHVFLRFFRPYSRYRKWVTRNLSPELTLPGVSLIGVTSAHGLTIASGRLKTSSLLKATRSWRRSETDASDQLKVLVLHHPITQIKNLRAVGDLCPDVVLSGHLHHSHFNPGHLAVTQPQCQSLIIQAGTATSTRLRKEVNSFNQITFHTGPHDRSGVEIELYFYDAKKHTFRLENQFYFLRTKSGWLTKRNANEFYNHLNAVDSEASDRYSSTRSS